MTAQIALLVALCPAFNPDDDAKILKTIREAATESHDSISSVEVRFRYVLDFIQIDDAASGEKRWFPSRCR
ncbi:MAG TPA: hypothetical protein VKU82_12565, partial [Planctomycetaceae bacterium]|nr:hypothetical protein [Planctomycetaceae bacterium]